MFKYHIVANSVAYSAEAQLKFHLNHGCAVFNEFYNYLFFTPSSINEVPKEIERIYAIYTGITTLGIVRPMNQVFKLHRSYYRHIKENKICAQIYENTGMMNCLMLMKVRKGSNYPLIESSEFCSTHRILASLPF